MLYGNMEARYRGWWLRCSRKAVRQQRYSLEALGRCRGSPPRSTSGTVHGISLSPEVLQRYSDVIIRHDTWVLQVFSHMAGNAPAPYPCQSDATAPGAGYQAATSPLPTR